MPMSDGQDMQMDIFGASVPTEALSSRCTRDETCRAEADQHEPDCPVEQRLREEIGY